MRIRQELIDMAFQGPHSVRYQAEALMTHAELCAYAEECVERGEGWPNRRFRVEGTRSGNSRLLTEQAALRTQRKYGGEIAEVLLLYGEYKRHVQNAVR